MIRNLMRITAIALLLTGCAHKGSPLIPGTGEEAIWQTFRETKVSGASYGNTVLSGSLRFGPADDTRRVTYSLWDTGSSSTDFVRLQVSAGVGAVIAEAMFDDSGMLLILPRDGKAYIGSDSPENISRILGFAFPFKVSRLKDYLSGAYYAALDEPFPEGFDITKEGTVTFHCTNMYGSMDITLDTEGKPSTLSHADKWSMTVTYGDDELPRRLDGIMKGPDGESRIVLLVKNRQPLPLKPENKLTVPHGFAVYDINN